MAKRRKFVPGREHGSVDLHRRKESDGEVINLPPVVIPPEGLVTDDPKILKFLDDHTLKGRRNGFVEVDMPGKLAEEDKKKKPPKAVAPDSNQDVDDEFLRLPDDAEFPYHKGGGYWYLSDGTKIQAKKDEAIEAEKALAKAQAAQQQAVDEQPEQEEDEQPEPQVVEEVKNLNQLKDWLLENTDKEAGDLSTKDDIEKAASELDPPAEFPNYDS
nr:hypothetical protein 12 [Balneolaceae bacterium]